MDTRKLFLHYGDLTDSTNIFQIISEVRPDELYNLGAQSHVKVRLLARRDVHPVAQGGDL